MEPMASGLLAAAPTAIMNDAPIQPATEEMTPFVNYLSIIGYEASNDFLTKLVVANTVSPSSS